MGMFDYVRARCPECEKESTNFQSKSGPCLMHTVETWEVRDYYGECAHCGAQVEVKRPQTEKEQLASMLEYVARKLRQTTC